MKRKKKTERQTLILSNDDIFRDIIRIRDKWTCQYSKKKIGVQVAHYFSRSYLSTRWEESNACLLGAGTHNYWAHVKFEEFRDWWLLRIGQDAFDRLKMKTRYSSTMYTHELKIMNIALKQRLKELGG